MAKQRKPRTNAYDARMIGDFLAHLEWELRAGHYEHAHPGSKTHPELVEQLKKYSLKYKKSPMLLMPHVTRTEPTPEFLRAYHKAMMERYQMELDCLEKLKPLLAHALAFVRNQRMGGKGPSDDSRMAEVFARIDEQLRGE